jgi:hypothetical protein
VTGVQTCALPIFNNVSDEQAIGDLQAALTGSGEVMKKYGVIVNEAAVKNELLNRSIDPTAATEAQKAQARFAIILRGTTAAQGDAARTAGGFANMIKRIKGQAFDAAAAVGSVLLPSLESLLASGSSVLSLTIEWIKQNAGLVKMLAVAGVALVIAGVAALGLASALTAASTIIGAVVSALAFVFSPIGIIIGLVAALGIGIVQMAGGADAAIALLKDTFPGLAESVGEVFGALKSLLAAGEYSAAAKMLWLGLKLAWVTGVDALNQEWMLWKKAFLDTFDSAVRTVSEKWATLQNSLSKGVVSFMSYFDSSINVDDVSAELDSMLNDQMKAIDNKYANRQQQRDAEFESNVGQVNQDLIDARNQWQAAKTNQYFLLSSTYLERPSANRERLGAQRLAPNLQHVLENDGVYIGA